MVTSSTLGNNMAKYAKH